MMLLTKKSFALKYLQAIIIATIALNSSYAKQQFQESTSCPEIPPPTLILKEQSQTLKKNHKNYYLGKPTQLTDHEYDQLKNHLEKIVQCFPQMASFIELPTDIGFENENHKFKHDVKMLSLKKAKSKTDVKDFIQRILQKYSEATFVIEPKFDGLALSLNYRNNRLQQALTRGDGLYGHSILNKITFLDKIPSKLEFGRWNMPKDTSLFIRGELHAHRQCYQQLASDLKSPRQLAVSFINQEKVDSTKLPCLQFFPYQILHNHQDIGDISEWRNQLYNQGFDQTIQYVKIIHKVEDIHQVRENIASQFPNSYLDGIVVKVREAAIRKALGSNQKYPHWSIAWKFSAPQAFTHVSNITYSKSRIGKLTPIVHINPIYFGRRKISKVSGHNLAWIQKQGIQVGSEIQVELAGHATPKIINALPIKKINTLKPVIWPKENKNLCLATHNSCKKRFIQQIVYMSKANKLNIPWGSKTAIKKLIKTKKLQNIADLLLLKPEVLHNTFQKSKINALTHSLNQLKSTPLSVWFYSLGIPQVSLEDSIKLFDLLSKNDQRITAIPHNEFMRISGLSKKDQLNIWHFISQESFKDNWKRLEQASKTSQL
ncbi:MAG: hypothetical protein AAGB12_11445 [Pseudomonadota bacterium]